MSHILICDDDRSIISALRLFLRSEGFEVSTASSPSEAEYFIKSQRIDLALIDLNYGADTTSGQEGIALTQRLHELDDTLAIVCMTGWASIEIAVEVMKAGAGDFVQKPWENERLHSIIVNQLKLRAERHQNQLLSAENASLKASLADSQPPLITHSAAMQKLMAQIEQVARTDINILITGPNGTGKSLLARHIHAMSTRSEHRFVSLNMGAVSESLFESELFGHVKGAFTDAKSQRIGRVELAREGTLFLDEIGNIPLSQQAKLLRLLEERQFERLGSSKTQEADFRLISATNADLAHMVQSQRFRQDLFYRLNTFVIDLPPLCQRQEDIQPMANAFIEQAARRLQKHTPVLSQEAIFTLMTYPWPGNIRELAHTMERATLLAANKITTEHLMLTPSQPHVPPQVHESESPEGTLDEIEKKVIERRLMDHKGNALAAAKSLGLSRSAFYRRLEKYQL